MATDAKKFHDVWVMNEEEAKDLVEKVLDEDRVIHEQQLGLPWKSPDVYVILVFFSARALIHSLTHSLISQYTRANLPF